MKRFLAVVLSLVFLFTAGCGSESQPKDTKLSKITIGLMPDTDSIPFIIAAERGYFAQEGIEVELVSFKSAMERDAALQSGNLDGAVSDLLAVIFARSGGFALHATSYTDGNYNLVAGGNAGISTAADLRGKEIAISRNTIIEYITDEILKINGLDEQDVSKVVIPQIPVRLEMLQSGNLAAAVLPEPMASVAAASGNRYVTGSAELGLNPGVIVFADAAIQEKAESIRAMYRAYNKSVDYLNHAPRAEYIDLVMDKSGFPAPARDALELKPYRTAGLPAEKDVEEAVHWVKSRDLAGDFRYDELVSNLLLEGK
ncbi:ABC transporter substrate-binding protein [Selenomonas dianae]|uniref:MetQ/NlpA family ABC transporter substrate-binding protein n=1 Tax=Selenomonas dianae TaxID=135079 RepID=A0ABN0T8N3_9FIRM|nr:MetQ/NlpA family ABC transporter substrate-binding protein [Selenomonas dianae]WLD83534.1 MetQ/NlpA family ABC transporter substrate-binding protein [Selenomonas dianae]